MSCGAARRSAWRSRMSTRRTAGYGCGCARRAASGTRCRVHNLEEYLTGYLDGAGLRGDLKRPLFRTIGRGTGKLTRTVLPQANAYAMIGRRAAAAGIATKLGNHSFRATGITAYLKNGGTLERRPQRWRTTPRPARRSSTIAGAMSSASTRSKGS